MEGLYIEEQDKRDLELERYDLALERILEISNESICPEPFRIFFHKMADFVGQMDQTWRLVVWIVVWYVGLPMIWGIPTR